MRAVNEQRLKEAVTSAQQQSAAIDTLTRTLSSLQITATTKNDEVSVTVDAAGKVLRVRVHPEHLRGELEGMSDQAAKELSDLLTRAGNAAQVAAEQEVRRRQRALIPGGSGRQAPAPDDARND